MNHEHQTAFASRLTYLSQSLWTNDRQVIISAKTPLEESFHADTTGPLHSGDICGGGVIFGLREVRSQKSRSACQNTPEDTLPVQAFRSGESPCYQVSERQVISMLQSAETGRGNDVRIDRNPVAAFVSVGVCLFKPRWALGGFRRPVGTKSNPYDLPPLSQPLITEVSRSLTAPENSAARGRKFRLTYKLSRNRRSAASSRHRFLPRIGLSLSSCVRNRSGVIRR